MSQYSRNDAIEREALGQLRHYLNYARQQSSDEEFMEAARMASFYCHMTGITTTKTARENNLVDIMLKAMQNRGIDVPALFQDVSNTISDTLQQFASLDKDVVPAEFPWDFHHPIIQLRILMLRADESEETFERAVSIRGLPSLPSSSSVWPLASSIISSSSIRTRAFIIDAAMFDKEKMQRALEPIKRRLEHPRVDDELRERLEWEVAARESHYGRLIRLQRLLWSISFSGQSDVVLVE